MESNLHDRDRVGVQDAVLLENYTSEVAFVDNLHKRFKEDIIYVSIYHNSLRNKFYISSIELLYYYLISDLYWSSTDLSQPLQGAEHLRTQRC